MAQFLSFFGSRELDISDFVHGLIFQHGGCQGVIDLQFSYDVCKWWVKMSGQVSVFFLVAASWTFLILIAGLSQHGCN